MIILPQNNPSFRFLLQNPSALLAFGFGSGLAPVMPGTVGTIAAIPFYLLLSQLSFWMYLLAVMLASLGGIYLCDVTAKKMGVHDHGGIVWDEFVGLWITLIAAPPGWPWIVVGFVLFRFFDIVKPWPISVADRSVKGGWGIMLDDILAGLVAAMVLQVTAYYWLGPSVFTSM